MEPKWWGMQSGATKIAATYVAVSGLWVLASDWWLGSAVGGAQQFLAVQTTKGVVFVTLSGLLIFGLIRREERRQAATNEDLERALKHSTVLHRLLRHNLRNSCDVIQNNVDLLQSGRGDEAENRDRIRRHAEKLATIASKSQELRDVVFDDEVEPMEQDMVAIVEEAIAAVRQQYPDATFTLETSDGQSVVAHPRLSVAVEELLANGVVHHESGTPTVTVTLQREGDEVVLSVTDDGPGLPDIERAVLEDGVEDVLTHSRGIGLWVVRFIVTASGGTLSVPSTGGEGTVVSVRLPAAAE